MKKIIVSFAVAASMMGCASNGVNVAATGGTTGVRTPAAVVNSDSLQVDLRDVAALLKGYFSVKKPDGKTTIAGYSAYVLENTSNGQNGRVIIFLEDPNNMDKQLLAVDNDKFLYSGGPFAGDEPSLATNRKDSLLIQSGNDGSGRNPWHESITVALRNGQLVVAGYDYDDYDRLGVDPGHNCSVNFLTGKGILRIDPPITKSGKSKIKNFVVSHQPVLLKDWTDAMHPTGCQQ
jgi:uncharacterized protein YceK